MIPPGQRKIVKTGLSIGTPVGTYGRIAPRSGLAWKKGIDVMAGVIDEDYRGEVGVILINLSEDNFCIFHGDRVAQLVIEKHIPCIVTETHDLNQTIRGHGGFGSTGI